MCFSLMRELFSSMRQLFSSMRELSIDLTMIYGQLA